MTCEINSLFRSKRIAFFIVVFPIILIDLVACYTFVIGLNYLKNYPEQMTENLI